MEKTERRWLWIGAAFTILFLVCIYKLTNASLWFDETVEYYYSKFLSGIEPVASSSGVAISTNMYERIISTFQPPFIIW